MSEDGKGLTVFPSEYSMAAVRQPGRLPANRVEVWAGSRSSASILTAHWTKGERSIADLAAESIVCESGIIYDVFTQITFLIGGVAVTQDDLYCVWSALFGGSVPS